MKHRASSEDDLFRQRFEECDVPASEFDHKMHVRLAFIYLCAQPPEQAHESMKGALLSFLDHLGVDPSKYHETITRAWVMAVRHFMHSSSPCVSATEFMKRNPVLLDSGIMLKHYSAEVLFSPAARRTFVEPDVAPIPRH